MDTRALYATIISSLAIAAATALAITGNEIEAATAFGLASSGLLFVIGLHSKPITHNED